ncbi:MAG: uroporphyrinogen-III C-methyltransferase [Gammaproteobacteria bacterium]|nr:uroporphyrinogen-III C-methyltransferase [Gammaproteobacteria bacterium]MCW5582525.1 uroporphyrinogen-III C-methyltransferase [Gammaproteobacteria bacterium]
MTDQKTIEENQPDNQPKTRFINWASVGIFFSMLALIIFVLAFGYGYFGLSRVNVKLAAMVSDLQSSVVSHQNDVAALKKSVSEMQSILQKAQEFSARQEQIISEWNVAQKGNLNQWQVAEAQYLTKMADDYLQFSYNTNTAVMLLQQADKTLQDIQEPRLLEIRKSLAIDLANLQALPQVDVTSLYLRLNAINDQVDQLSLPVNPLHANNQQDAPITVPSGLPWWKAGLEYTWQGLSRVVVVRKNGAAALPLVLPEEKIFLYQNLHAQIENAMWSVLHRNPEVYQASLSRAARWVKQYFDQEVPATKAMLQNIEELKKINIQPPTIHFSNTLQLFNHYFVQTKQGQ